MKFLYQCEKCGNMHNSIDAAIKCESSHLIPDFMRDDEFYDEIKGYAVYDVNKKLPKTIRLHFCDESGDYFADYGFKSQMEQCIVEGLMKRHFAKKAEEDVNA